MLTGWASRRTEDAGGTVRALTVGTAGFALVLLLPQTILGYAALVMQTITRDAPGKPFWALSVTYGFGCSFLGVLLFAVALGTAALVARPARDPVVEPTAGTGP
ncbi:hypothetical protein COUCH_13675 [Couchioplanes caeruleus]|uniref:hypothetical protein n=1 Tax=Couchioplanes caeruleus TaxID=56438 RepID=UPI0020C012F6|nr:hypothetical protein [Couchioplanes caeruleus]UQU67248.1 hypothetical protein COUCH_13675 [Couchioplanes caeruleus]